MVRIIYSVAGEGNGHAVRSKTSISYLRSQGHDVRVFSHGKGYKFLNDFFDVKRILGFHIYYIDNTTSSVLTALVNTFKFPIMFLFNLRYIFDFIIFNPDIVITDFEPFVAYYSHLFFKPLISIDNQHIITNTRIKRNGLVWLYYLYSWFVIKLFIPLRKLKIITRFFYPKIKRKNVCLVNPILQKEIIRAKPKNNRHIFVYQTSNSYNKMLKVLKGINKKFIIYGFDKECKNKNLIFKKFNEDSFFYDLANSEAVIINGGFTLLGEAIYLKKPIFSIPIHKQFEQMLNGYYVEKLGYGKCVKRINNKNFLHFLSNLSIYKKNLNKFKHDKNQSLFNKLNFIIRKFRHHQ